MHNNAPGTVLIVHGLWVNAKSMAMLASHVRKAGFDTITFSYPSVTATLSENAQRLADFAVRHRVNNAHFVGHSLGGLLVLQMLHEHPAMGAGRVVLLGSPYADCYAARNFSLLPVGHRLTGRSMHQWLQQDKPPLPAGAQIGVIAGSRHIGLGRLIPGLPRPNDGTVAVAETRVPGMRDHIVLRVTHSEMFWSRRVRSQVVAFLERGQFVHNHDEPSAPFSRPDL